MNNILNSEAKDLLFREARSHNSWQDKDVDPDLLREIYDLMKFAPTSTNSNPVRIQFVCSAEEKAKLEKHLWEPNIEKVMSAPVTAIISHDNSFHEHLLRLFPHKDMRPLYQNKKKYALDTAFRNAALQGGYLMLAARAFGLDCGPISGFDNESLDLDFFPESTIKSNFLCNLGYGNGEKLFPRLPRFEFDEVCKIT